MGAGRNDMEMNSLNFSNLPLVNFEENVEYDMVYISGSSFWDFWLSKTENIRTLEWWRTRMQTKVLLKELKKIEAAKPNDLAIILLPSGFAVRAKIFSETSRDEYGAFAVSFLDVDTGQMMSAYVDDLYIPDEELMKKKPLAVNCCLNLDNTAYDQKLLQSLRAGNLKVVFKRVTLSNPCKFVVDIIIERKGSLINILEDIKNEDYLDADTEESSEMAKLEKKTKICNEGEAIYDVYIPHVQSLSRFFVMESAGSMDDFKSLMLELKSSIKPTSVRVPDNFLNSLSNGDTCAVFDVVSLQWFRGEILNHSRTKDYKGLVQSHYEVLFVDLGNIADIPISLMRPLPQKFFKIPALAVCCHLYGLEPEPNYSSSDGNDYSKDVIEIFEMFLDSGRITLVEAPRKPEDLLDSIPVILEREYKDNSYIINLELLTQKLVRSKVFDLEMCNQALKAVESGKLEDLNVYLTHKNALEDGTSPQPVVPYSPRKIAFAEVVEPEYSEEELNRWNPMEEDYIQSEMTNNDINDDASALLGYQSKDEGRVCKLFARSGYCFKGANCRKEHRYLRPDGVTTDCELVHAETFSFIGLPKPGSVIKLKVTFVIDICKFYAVLSDSWRYKETACEYLPNEKSNEDNLETLMDLINAKENVFKLQRLQSPPGVGEIVLCKTSNLYHRAKVMDTNLEAHEFLVLYVDIGTTEWAKAGQIRKIEKSHLHLPFQAVECQLAHYGVPENLDGGVKMEIMRRFSKLIASKELEASVVRRFSQVNKMIVELFDESGINIGDMLEDDGYLIKMSDLYEGVTKIIPG